MAQERFEIDMMNYLVQAVTSPKTTLIFSMHACYDRHLIDSLSSGSSAQDDLLQPFILHAHCCIFYVNICSGTALYLNE